MAAWKTAGKVRMTPKGEHNSNSTYEVLDLVSSSDGLSYYIAKKAVPSGIALSNTQYWDAVININTILNGCVSADDFQMFSEAQKSTARSNISAASTSDIEYVINQNVDNGLAGSFPNSEWYSNYRISCGTIGGNIEWVASNGYKCVDYSCSAGDVFIINTSADADEGYCCFAFVDSNSKVIANSGADVVTMSNQRIVAPDDTARLIINGIMSSSDICYIGDYVGTKIQNVDTRVEELEDYIKDMSPNVTLSEQDMVHIEDAAPLAPDSLEFDVVATQDGSGTPSPTNIRPIRAIESIKWHKARKNLLCGMRRIRAEYNGIEFSDPGDGGIHVKGTATDDAYSDYTASESAIKSGNYPFLPAGQYVFPAPIPAESLSPMNSAYYYISILNRNFDQIGSDITIYSDSDLNTRTVTLTEPCWIYYRIKVPSGRTINATFYPAIYCADDVPEEWVAYSGEEYDIAIPSSAGLVYACKVDSVAGKLKVYGVSQTFTGSDIEKRQWTISNGVFRYQRFNYMPDQNSGNQIAIVCSHYKCVDNDHDETDMYYCVNRNTDSPTPSAPAHYFADSNYTTVNDWCDYLAAQNTAGTPVTVVYRIQTPIEYDISELDINLFKGLNNIWCDDGKTSITYRADAFTYLMTSFKSTISSIITEEETGLALFREG